MTSTLKAVLFDLDDTLFDHRGCARAALERLRADFPSFAARPFAELECDYHRLLEEYHALMLAGAITQETSRRERFRQLLALSGAAPDEAQAARAAQFYNESYLSVYRAVPGAEALLRALAGRVKIGIVSNNLLAEQIRKLKICGLVNLIDALVVSEEAGFAKPDPAIFHEALRRLDCRPAEAVMIGDSWAGDVLGAHAAGIRAIWFNPLGAPCPDPALATEIRSLEPTEIFVITFFEIGPYPKTTR